MDKGCEKERIARSYQRVLNDEENRGLLLTIRLCVGLAVIILAYQFVSSVSLYKLFNAGRVVDDADDTPLLPVNDDADREVEVRSGLLHTWYRHDEVARACQVLPIFQRFDCFPELGASEEKCVKRGCCWQPVERVRANKYVDEVGGGVRRSKSIGVPYCYYPLHSFPGYSITSQNTTEFGVTARIRRSTQSYYPLDITEAQVDVFYETDDRLRIKIFDPNKHRYEVPIDRPEVRQKAANPNYHFNLTSNQEGKFILTVTRKSTGATLFNTSVGEFLFSDQFLQLSSQLASREVYGLGEHRDTLVHSTNWTRFVFWTRDQFPASDANLYGVHPFYMLMEPDGSSHGVMLLNSNALEVILQPTPAVTWRSIGGIFDVYIMLGPRPDTVVTQLTEVVGRPALPPYWGLGYHLCRWGYRDEGQLKQVIQGMRDGGFPYDTQWNDIDYMHKYLDFTYDKTRYKSLPDIIQDLHDHGQHYVIITDPGISSTQPPGSYPPYDEGVNMDIFIRHLNGSLLIGSVWPGLTTFPDYTHPMAQEYWTNQIARLHSDINFDGLWIDMNEPSNALAGSTIGCTDTSLDHPPYSPYVSNSLLYDRTLCPSARQYLSSHYNLHNMYGYFEAKLTHNSLVSVRGSRPLVISRSTFTGSGRYTGHWLGDNVSTWKDMYYSIPGILHLQMYGVPLVGVDICGFRGNTTEELCVRWTQLGAFYPFSRNHNDEGAAAQDPTVFSPRAQASMRRALLTRYLLLPYLYSLFHLSNTQGHTVARPLFFEFPLDKVTYSIDRQFMWGPALLISPVLEQGAVSVRAYVPAGVWYDLFTGQQVLDTGMFVELAADLDTINLHVRGGFILPTQQPAYNRPPGPVTTTASRLSAFGVVVALDQNKEANGTLFWDDGESVDSYERKIYNKITFTATSNTVVCKPTHIGYTGGNMVLGSAVVFGVGGDPSQVSVNGKALPQHSFTYSLANQVLNITTIDISLVKPVTILWK